MDYLAGDSSIRSYWNCPLPSIRHWFLDPQPQFPSCVAQASFWTSLSFCWGGAILISLCFSPCVGVGIPEIESIVTCCRKGHGHHHLWQWEQADEVELRGGNGSCFEPWRRGRISWWTAMDSRRRTKIKDLYQIQILCFQKPIASTWLLTQSLASQGEYQTLTKYF